MRTTERWLPRLVIVAWLTLVWVFLWGSFTLGNVVGGAVAASVLVLSFPLTRLDEDRARFRPLPALSFLLWFVAALVRSSLTVAREALVPSSRSRVRPGVVAVPLRTRSGRLATLVANTITLTPGTLTLEARGRPATLFVHVMALADPEQARADVAEIERRVVRAFGAPSDVAAVRAAASARADALPGPADRDRPGEQP